MDSASVMESNSNKYFLNDYQAPRWDGTSIVHNSESPAAQTDADQEEANHLNSFTIRHLKQGATGAVRTWPAAEVLLDYLVRRGGLLGNANDVAARRDSTVLDLSGPPNAMQQTSDLKQLGELTASHCYNVMELGAGSGYLGVGLSLAMNQEACRRFNGSSAKHVRQPFQPQVRVMCTDNDKTTIKNMRHNIASQPPARNVSKAVKVESLDWGSDDIAGDKFSNAIQSFFSGMQSCGLQEEDPINLLTHMVASDVHYGESTLEPLSTIVSACKLRNPQIVVILLLRERSPNAVADLKSQIEEKVHSGLEDSRMRKQLSLSEEVMLMPRDRICADEQLRGLEDFSVSVRDVNHKNVTNMKMVEC